MNNVFKRIVEDESGVILSAEMVLILTIAVLGIIVGLAEITAAVVTEFQDLALAFNSLNQSFATPTFAGCWKWFGRTSFVSGSAFFNFNRGCIGPGAIGTGSGGWGGGFGGGGFGGGGYGGGGYGGYASYGGYADIGCGPNAICVNSVQTPSTPCVNCTPDSSIPSTQSTPTPLSGAPVPPPTSAAPTPSPPPPAP